MLYFAHCFIRGDITIYNRYYLLSLCKTKKCCILTTQKTLGKIIAAKFFDSIIMLIYGKTKVAKEEFYGVKKPEKIAMLMLVIQLSQN